MWLTDLADVLRAGGLRVVEIDGWKWRGYLNQQMAGVRSVITHWTATNPGAGGDYPTLGTILNGTASTPGPLAQLGLGRSGTFYVCAAGLCNHAGVVDHVDHSNPLAIGIEAEYHPDQGAWPDVQQRAYERGTAALSQHYRFPVSQIQGHYEVARPVGRKPDPSTLPGGMPGFRDRVQKMINEGLDDVSAEDVWNYPITNPADGFSAPAKDWVFGTARDTGKALDALEEMPEQMWTAELAGDPTPDGAPFSAEARKWLVDRARDVEVLSARLDRQDALLEAIAAELGVTPPDAG
jgi:hypothetical protein